MTTEQSATIRKSDVESLAQSLATRLSLPFGAWTLIYNAFASTLGFPTVSDASLTIPARTPLTPTGHAHVRDLAATIAAKVGRADAAVEIEQILISGIENGPLSGAAQADRQQARIDEEDRAAGRLATRDAGTGQTGQIDERTGTGSASPTPSPSAFNPNPNLSASGAPTPATPAPATGDGIDLGSVGHNAAEGQGTAASGAPVTDQPSDR